MIADAAAPAPLDVCWTRSRVVLPLRSAMAEYTGVDDLAQYSPRRRERPEPGATGPFVSPLRFKLAPPIPLTGRRREPHAWRPRLG